MNITQSIIEILAEKNGYRLSEIRDYFVDFCKDSDCLYYKCGHLWVLTNENNNNGRGYLDWSGDYLEIISEK